MAEPAPASAQAAVAPSTAVQAAPARIGLASWLEGCWDGEGLGGRLQECWSAANGTQMSGHFTLAVDGRPRFHEFLLLEEHEGGLRLRVKHFNPDMTGWEERDQSVDFRFVSADARSIVFTALAIEREGRSRMVMRLTMRQADGERRVEVLRFRRVRA
jgi:hypothetical protein